MDIGRKLAELEKRIARMEASPRLSHAAIDNTSIEVRDGTGSLRGLLGVQADGTTAMNSVNGPPPPQPTTPIVASVLGGITASWDGHFADGSPAPLDWQRVEVHASTTSGFTPSPETLRATIETPQGATTVVTTDDPVYVRLLARSTSGTASTPSEQAGPAGPTPVVADELRDGIVTTSKLAAGAVNINALTESLADTASQRFVDAMGDPAVWTVLTQAPGSVWGFLDNVTDAPTGKTVAQGTGFLVIRGTTQIPYDPDVLYRISARVRTTAASVSGTDTLYVGALGVAADGTTFVNRTGANSYYTQHYAAASNNSQPTSSGWVTYVGYLKGRAASGTVGTSLDARTPGVVHDNVRFISPLIYLNFGSGTSGNTGTMQVDAFTIEALKTGVVGSSNLVAGSVTTAALAADSVTATKILAGSVEAAKIATGAVTTGKLDALAVTSDKIAANAITVGKIAAGAVDATAIAADAITGKTITGGTITGTTVTGGLIQTATSGERIAINELGQNKAVVYDSTGTAVGEFSARGLRLLGDSGALLFLDPDATYPQLAFWNAANTNRALAQLVEPTVGDANLEIIGGKFTGSGYTDMRWRLYLARDFVTIERLRGDDPSRKRIGGRFFANETQSIIQYLNDDDATLTSTVGVYSGNYAEVTNGRLRILPPASSNSALFVNAATGYTGSLLRAQLNGVDKFTVDKDGNLTVAGIGQRQTKRRTSDATKANTITPATDTQITFTVDANAVYLVDGWLKYSGPGDFLIGWTFPTGTQGEWCGIGNGTTVVSGTAGNGTQQDIVSSWGYAVRTETTDVGSTRTYGGIGSTAFGVMVRGTFRVGATGGTLALQWAQGSLHATATTLYTDSYVRLEKVA